MSTTNTPAARGSSRQSERPQGRLVSVAINPAIAAMLESAAKANDCEPGELLTALAALMLETNCGEAAAADLHFALFRCGSGREAPDVTPCWRKIGFKSPARLTAAA